MPTLTREELYALVWADPIQKIAPRYGLSDRGLGKLCARYKIPVPPRGYWAKKAAGKRVKQPPLPPEQNQYRQKIHFERLTSVAEEVQKPEVHPLVAFEDDPTNAIAVPPDLIPSHPIVLKTQRLLNRGKRDATGRVAAPPGGLHVHASRAMHERVLRILEVLVRALERRDLTVADGKVMILDEPLAIGIEEGTRKEPHRTTFTEQKLIDRGMGWQVPKFDQVPSGLLTLAITNAKGVRQRWAETPSRPLEQLPNRFIVGLVRAALGLKRQRGRRSGARRSARKLNASVRRRRNVSLRRPYAGGKRGPI